MIVRSGRLSILMAAGMPEHRSPGKVVRADASQNHGCDFVKRGDYNDCLHNAGGRGQLFEDCCASCREAVLNGFILLKQAFDQHSEWCGYNADAPGDGIVNEAERFLSWVAPWAEYQRMQVHPR